MVDPVFPLTTVGSAMFVSQHPPRTRLSGISSLFCTPEDISQINLNLAMARFSSGKHMRGIAQTAVTGVGSLTIG